jgi:hypothetical protein
MGHDDREKKFEQALARHLRSRTDAAGQAGAAPAPEAAGAKYGAGASCPDAETLAAFHERMLSNEEMNGTKAHVAGCSRCQEILAHLEATDDVVMEEQDRVLTMREPEMAAGAPHEEYAAVSAAAPAMAARPSAASRVQDISRPRGARKWRWTAPAGAIAAGLLIWFVMQENRPLSFNKKANVQIAQQQSSDERTERQMQPSPPPAAAPEKGTELSSEPLSNEGVRNRPAEGRVARPPAKSLPGAIGGMVAGSAGGARGGLRDSDALSAAKSGNDVARQQGADKFAVAPENRNAPKLPAPARTESGGVAGNPADDLSASVETRRKVLSEAKSAPAMTAAGAQPAAPLSEAAKTAAKQDEEAAQKKEADVSANRVGMATEQIQVTAGPGRISASQKDKTAEAKIIASPGGTVSWRVGAKGRIERSVDSGITWSRQKSGSSAELLAGSAPSAAVCWIVGRQGTILRSTDGGGHWGKVAAPVTGDISGIAAEDAMHAVIFGEGGGKFVTSDGGATWVVRLK